MTDKAKKAEKLKNERNFTYEPVPECVGKSFQMVGNGNFRIIVKGKESLWESYEGIANLEVDGEKYIGVSEYFKGSLPTECVLKIEKVDEYGYHGYVKIKINDIRGGFPGETLNKDDITELLSDILPPNNYVYFLKEIPGDTEGFFKVKIIDMEGKQVFEVDDLNILDKTKIIHLLKKLLFEKDYELVLKDNY